MTCVGPRMGGPWCHMLILETTMHAPPNQCPMPLIDTRREYIYMTSMVFEVNDCMYTFEFLPFQIKSSSLHTSITFKEITVWPC